MWQWFCICVSSIYRIMHIIVSILLNILFLRATGKVCSHKYAYSKWHWKNILTTSESLMGSIWKIDSNICSTCFCCHVWYPLKTLRPRQNGRHFADDIFKCIFLNENIWIATKISMKFVPKGPINNIPALVEIKAWRRPGDKPLSEPMMVSLTTHICVTRPQWVNKANPICFIQCCISLVSSHEVRKRINNANRQTELTRKSFI